MDLASAIAIAGKAIGAGLCMGIGAIGPGVGEGNAVAHALDGMARFPDKAILYCCAGDIAKTLKRYDDAFAYWRKTLELDPDIHTAAYAMGFCYEELGQFDKAYRVWCDITKELDRRGLTIERKYTADLAENCRKKLN